ncbi:MAG: hypothetical protein WA718_12960 [Terriglobales bacterium]
MTLKSAYDDLRQTTLEKIPGTLEKLQYVAGLRGATGLYQHWGFERQHGPEESQLAFNKVHMMLVKEVLKTPLKVLQQDLERSSEAHAASPLSYALQLSIGSEHLLPADSPKQATMHLVSVLETLSALAVHKSERSQPS